MIVLDTIELDGVACLASFLSMGTWNAQYSGTEERYRLETVSREFRELSMRWREHAGSMGIRYRITAEAEKLLGFS